LQTLGENEGENPELEDSFDEERNTDEIEQERIHNGTPKRVDSRGKSNNV
jgi:hypothetical protein